MACSRDCRYLPARLILRRRLAADHRQNLILPSPIRGPGCPKGTVPTTHCRWTSPGASAEAYRCAESTRSPKFWMTEIPTTAPPPEMRRGWCQIHTMCVRIGDWELSMCATPEDRKSVV